MEYIFIVGAALLSNNIVFSQTLGICPYLGVSKKTDTAIGMGLAVVFVMALTSLLTYAVYTWVLVPLEIQFMQTIVFIFLIAAVVQLLEILLKRFVRPLYNALGIYLPLITTNCAVLGTALVNLTNTNVIDSSVPILGAFLNGMFMGAGFMLALILMSGIRERISKYDVPGAFKGFPIALVSASIIAMVFLVFAGMF